MNVNPKHEDLVLVAGWQRAWIIQDTHVVHVEVADAGHVNTLSWAQVGAAIVTIQIDASVALGVYSDPLCVNV